MAFLGDETRLEMLDTDGTTWFLIVGARQIGGAGEEAPLVDITALDQSGKSYIAGIPDGEEKEIVCNYEKNNADQLKFRTAARNRESGHSLRIVYKDGTQAEFGVTFLGFKMNETSQEEAVQFTVKCKQNGLTTWTEPA